MRRNNEPDPVLFEKRHLRSNTTTRAHVRRWSCDGAVASVRERYRAVSIARWFTRVGRRVGCRRRCGCSCSPGQPGMCVARGNDAPSVPTGVRVPTDRTDSASRRDDPLQVQSWQRQLRFASIRSQAGEPFGSPSQAQDSPVARTGQAKRRRRPPGRGRAASSLPPSGRPAACLFTLWLQHGW